MPDDEQKQGNEGHQDELTELLVRAAVLVIDDEPGMRNFLVKTLRLYCREVVEAENIEQAEIWMRQMSFDVVLLDNVMPGRNGIEWLGERYRQGAIADTIVVTAYADLDTAIEAMRAGARDFILKPVRSNQVLNAVRRCIELGQLKRENVLLRHELQSIDIWRRRRSELIGDSEEIEEVRRTLGRVVNMPTPVLVCGESGTGKEVAARHLHAASERAVHPFVAVNCAAIPADMLETELFGHTRNAFAGAEGYREGLLVSAQGGTVFLDEIGELSAAAQLALTRVLEDRSVRPVGGEQEVPLDLRFVCATSKDLLREVAEGRFREDLYFRVNVIEIKMPPLRCRGADTLALAELFMSEIARQLGLARLEIDSTTRMAILRHRWPGNIRELLNFVERSLIFGRFPLETLAPPPEAEIETLEAVERRQILDALEATHGNRAEAARRLGVSRKTVDRKCAAWGI